MHPIQRLDAAAVALITHDVVTTTDQAMTRLTPALDGPSPTSSATSTTSTRRSSRPEILALDWWSTHEGLQEHYGDPAMPTVLNQDVVGGPIETTLWQQRAGFTEW
jgi:hypothetical protein